MTANEQTKAMAPHYLKGAKPQHWDMMWELYREAWFVGNITKYVMRYREKNGVEDLKKARHYLDKLIELEEANGPKAIPAAGKTDAVPPTKPTGL